ncbi:PAS domain S-box-containing protein [Malonomonas rubra DSM 5091]|uniref:histidine kinase n=1 Tax=Malonomonas rubra DSM 5091 TaxID=1122189 RepID=A0A1M6MPQ7_MALRU|nr:PAS domain-containing sensor histidine kinase [Malonomonas rubra]SHJ85495.1 PAS domain S-box-containing protein [Malonomonas rubra DSM 5091]
MKNFRYTIIFNLLLVLFFCGFVYFQEAAAERKLQREIEFHADILAPSVWTLFTPLMEQYLTLAVKSNDYRQMQVTSQVDQNLLFYHHDLENFEKWLFDAGIIRLRKLSTPIVYKEQNIGHLKISAYNKNFYLYAYLSIVLILTSLLSWFVALLYRERKTLKIRVEEKTAELAENNQQLQNEIKERLIKEKALRESEQTFLALFDHSFQFIALLDLDCRVRKINKTALSFRDLQEKDIIGKQFWETPWWSHSEKLVQQLKDAFKIAAEGQVARFEAHSVQMREIYLDITIKPVFNEEGEVIFVIAEARDITEVRRAENELKQAQKMESVGTLAGGIAHDFNNILGGILGTLALLKLKRDKGQQLSEEKLFSSLDTITETALRAKDIVSQLLTLSRKYDLKLSQVNLYDILQNVLKIAENSFDKSISIDCQMSEQLPVKADSNSLEQVFLNLCINAAHAMTIMRSPGDAWGGELNIRVKSIYLDKQLGRKAGEYWCISIIDTGVGMDEANLKQIFVPFFTTKNKDAGTGLGLSMVYNIVKQHEGFIDVDSQPGKGSSFYIYLPICSDEKCRQVDESEVPLVSGEGLILIIDDEELIRSNAAELLEECGYQTMLAENGAQGIEIYRQQQGRVDAVLLDLVMPVMSGKETYAALKEIDPQVKVLLSSGFRQDTRVDEILAAGADGFIQKPYSFHQLSQAIGQLLN